MSNNTNSDPKVAAQPLSAEQFEAWLMAAQDGVAPHCLPWTIETMRELVKAKNDAISVLSDQLHRIERAWCREEDLEDAQTMGDVLPIELRLRALSDDLAERQLSEVALRRELKTALDRLSMIVEAQAAPDPRLAALEAERDEARAASAQIGQALLQVQEHAKTLVEQLRADRGARDFLAVLLKESHRSEVRLEDSLRALTQQSAAPRRAA